MARKKLSRSRKRWTEDELEKLEEWAGIYTVQQIADRLGRSFDAVNIKVGRTGIRGFEKNTEMLTLHQLCIMMGVDSRTVKKKWKDHGLKIGRRRNYVVISQNDLFRFLKNNPDDWSAARVTDDSLLMGQRWYITKKHADQPKSYFWKSTEVSRLKILYAKGVPMRQIAEKMGRSYSSIRNKVVALQKEGFKI